MNAGYVWTISNEDAYDDFELMSVIDAYLQGLTSFAKLYLTALSKVDTPIQGRVSNIVSQFTGRYIDQYELWMELYHLIYHDDGSGVTFTF